MSTKGKHRALFIPREHARLAGELRREYPQVKEARVAYFYK